MDPRTFAARLGRLAKNADAPPSPPALKTYMAGEVTNRPPVKRSEPAAIKPAKINP